MDKKTIIASVITFAATAILGIIFGAVAGVFERGSEALTEDQIKKVLKEVLVTDRGDSYGKVLSDVSDRLLVVETKLTSMEKALTALAAE